MIEKKDINKVKNRKPFQISVQQAHMLYNAYLQKMMGWNQPAQDYLAELYYEDEEGRLYRYRDLKYAVEDFDSFCSVEKKHNFKDAEQAKELFVGVVLAAISALENHFAEGYNLGLRTEEIVFHDEIFGYFTDHFDDEVVALAQEFYRSSEMLLRNLNLHDLDLEADVNEQTPEVKHEIARFEDLYVDNIKSIRKKLGSGWVDDLSLSYGYLLEHSHMKIYGVFEEVNPYSLV